MAHDLEIVDGVASFFSASNINAWHRLGTVVENAQTAKKAIKLAKMNWKVVKEPFVNPFTGEATDKFLIYREDNKHIFQVTSGRYEPMQNEFMFEFMDAILDADDKANYETAGVLGKGERVFITANIGTEYDVLGSGDKHKAYLVACGSHDGTMSTEFFISETRVVCNNTLQVARKGAKNRARVKRTVNAEARLNQKLQDLAGAREMFKTLGEKLDFLATKKINTKVVDDVLKKVYQVEDLEDLSGRAKGSVELVQQFLEHNDGDAFPQFRGTAYNLLNAFTEYADHASEVRVTAGREGLSKETIRAEASIFGNASDFKTEALNIILEEAQTLRSVNGSKSYSIAKSDASILDSIISAY